MWSGRFSTLRPSEFKHTLSLYHPQFKDYRQVYMILLPYSIRTILPYLFMSPLSTIVKNFLLCCWIRFTNIWVKLQRKMALLVHKPWKLIRQSAEMPIYLPNAVCSLWLRNRWNSTRARDQVNYPHLAVHPILSRPLPAVRPVAAALGQRPLLCRWDLCPSPRKWSNLCFPLQSHRPLRTEA